MTLFDHVVLTIIGFSVLTGLLRGLTREVIALAGWVVAFFVASTFSGDAAPLLAKQIPDDSWRVLAAFVAVFFATLIAMSVMALLVSKLVNSAGLGFEDRMLGGLFGFARGLLLVLVLVLVAGMTALPRQTVWKDAMLSAPLEKLALMAKQWLPQSWAKYISYN